MAPKRKKTRDGVGNTETFALLRRIKEACRRGEPLPTGLPPPRPSGPFWKLENWFDVDSGEYSWHWVGMPSPDQFERALGQADDEFSGSEQAVKPRQSTAVLRQQPESGLLRPKDAWEYRKVSRSQFFEWVRRGYVNKIKLGRYVRYSIKSLDAMLERFEQPSVRAPRHKWRMRRLGLP
jgi:hypothetical protein